MKELDQLLTGYLDDGYDAAPESPEINPEDDVIEGEFSEE